MFNYKPLSGEPGGPPATTNEAEDTEARALREAARGTNLRVRRLRRGEEASVLATLRAQPVKNVMSSGLILDNGLENDGNRGTFYGCFAGGELKGVSLIGHHVLLSGSLACAGVFARLARLRHMPDIRVLLGEDVLVARFCRRLEEAPNGLSAHQRARHLLLSLSGVARGGETFAGLRQALPEETLGVVRMNADAFMELYGVNPTSHDPSGFRQRTLTRVRMGRVWVITDEAGIIFKTEVVSATDDAVYLEGVFTRPDARGTGLGSAALRALCRTLLDRYKAICLLADAGNARTLDFYRKIGFAPEASYMLVRYAGPVERHAAEARP
jgi:ribosomal protein S18 acetylase RimI-like enzyme